MNMEVIQTIQTKFLQIQPFLNTTAQWLRPFYIAALRLYQCCVWTGVFVATKFATCRNFDVTHWLQKRNVFLTGEDRRPHFGNFCRKTRRISGILLQRRQRLAGL